MTDESKPSQAKAIARAVGAALGTFAAKSGLAAKAHVEAGTPVKHRLPRKLKKALKKAQLAESAG